MLGSASYVARPLSGDHRAAPAPTDAQPTADAAIPFEALRIPAAADALPSLIELPKRVDYLYALTEVLDTPAVASFPLSKNKGGQRLVQPTLYVAVVDDDDENGGGGREAASGGEQRPINAIASFLAGVTVRGDALLTSLEFRDSEGVEGLLTAREPGSPPSSPTSTGVAATSSRSSARGSAGRSSARGRSRARRRGR